MRCMDVYDETKFNNLKKIRVAFTVLDSFLIPHHQILTPKLNEVTLKQINKFEKLLLQVYHIYLSLS